MTEFLGLRTVIYPAPDLAAAKAWWTEFLAMEPYFDEPFYVGFNPGGYELGLLPDADPAATPPPVEPYRPGSWGPPSVGRVIEPYRWHLDEKP